MTQNSIIENFTKEQLELLESLKKGDNVIVTGPAGVGKTYVVRLYIDQERNEGKKVLVCAPTGLAARNIDGFTIHRTFQVPVHALDPNQDVTDPPTWVEEANIIVVDEVSMVRLDLFDFMAKVIKAAQEKSGVSKQLILLGDFLQLPPVIQFRETNALHKWYKGQKNVKAGYAFLSKTWHSFNFKVIDMHIVVRQQDAEFSDALNKLRFGHIAGYKWILKHQSPEVFTSAPWICPTRNKVEQINQEALDQLEGSVQTYQGHRTGIVLKDDMPAEEVIKLKCGARVMVLANDPKGQYQNGSFATVVELKPKSVVVKLDTVPDGMPDTAELKPFIWIVNGYAKVVGEVEPSADGEINCDYTYEPRIIGKYTQIPLKLAYAFTIHKCQGQTFSFPVNIDVNVFCRGQLYTALSRVTKVENLHIEGDPKSCYKADPVVKKFYKNLEAKSS